MNVKFWGCRGSLPASYKAESVHQAIQFVLNKAVELGVNHQTNLEEFIKELPFGIRSTYGTNTPCVEIVGGSEYIICDAGSGMRDLGKSLVSNRSDKHMVINLIMSHLHWDHMQGFPFLFQLTFKVLRYGSGDVTQISKSPLSNNKNLHFSRLDCRIWAPI